MPVLITLGIPGIAIPFIKPVLIISIVLGTIVGNNIAWLLYRIIYL